MTTPFNTSPSAFYASARQLAIRVNLQDMRWRHHGLGMLQAEFDETLRVHVWHPKLRTLPLEGLRDVHDHRFDLQSTVLVGELLDLQYRVINDAPEVWATDPATAQYWEKTECWEIKHTKEILSKRAAGCSTADATVKLGDVFAQIAKRQRYAAGDTYAIPRRAFHTTRVEDLAISIVHRSNFDDRLARVLGDASDAARIIVPDEGINEKVLRAFVLHEADCALANLRYAMERC